MPSLPEPGRYPCPPVAASHAQARARGQLSHAHAPPALRVPCVHRAWNCLV